MWLSLKTQSLLASNACASCTGSRWPRCKRKEDAVSKQRKQEWPFPGFSWSCSNLRCAVPATCPPRTVCHARLAPATRLPGTCVQPRASYHAVLRAAA
eukprot:1678418-Prymnesium_polylepis.1